MSLYSFIDEEKQDPKTWALAATIKKNKKKEKSYLDNVDIDDIDLLDDNDLDMYLTDMI